MKKNVKWESIYFEYSYKRKIAAADEVGKIKRYLGKRDTEL